MDRNKRPALTSPWKIGFLVSLLLVTVSIAVGFAVTRTFSVAWSWIQIGGGTWAFDMDAFMHEMLPLVLIVPVMSLVSYFVITGAVRKYRAYVDSGLDYRNLVKSFRQVDDLQEDRIKSLSDYPELRDFLLKIQKRVKEREKALDEREAGIVARQEEVEAADAMKSEARLLIGAISNGPVDGFAEELQLTVPELQRIEKAIREHLLVGGAPITMDDLGEQMANIRAEIVDSTAALRSMIDELLAEMVASQNGAREIELYLNQLKTVTGGGTTDAGEAAQALGLVDRLDQTSAALAALGEETKSIAINAALHAGQGQGDLSGLVKLADAVRDIAARFNGVAAQYQEVGQQVRAGVQSMSGAGADGQLTETIETMADKVTYWVERAVVLQEKLNAFAQQFGEVTTAFQSKLGGTPTEDTYQTVDDLSTGDEAGPDPRADIAAAAGLDAQEAGAAKPAAPIAGLERNRNLFEEIGGSSDDNLFADIPAQDTAEPSGDATGHTGLTGVFERNEIHSPPADDTGTAARPGPQKSADEAPATQTSPADTPPAAAPPEQQPQSPRAESAPAAHSSELFEEMGAAPPVEDESLAPPPGHSRIEPGEFVQSQPDLSGREQGPKPGAGDQASQSADSSLELESHRHEPPPARSAEEKVYDLYELGAVDYEPSVHHSA